MRSTHRCPQCTTPCCTPLTNIRLHTMKRTHVATKGACHRRQKCEFLHKSPHIDYPPQNEVHTLVPYFAFLSPKTSPFFTDLRYDQREKQRKPYASFISHLRASLQSTNDRTTTASTPPPHPHNPNSIPAFQHRSPFSMSLSVVVLQASEGGEQLLVQLLELCVQSVPAFRRILELLRPAATPTEDQRVKMPSPFPPPRAPTGGSTHATL